MTNNVNIGYISSFLSNPAFLEMRFTIVSNEDGFRGYITGDREKIIEYIGDNAEEVFSKISNYCDLVINS
jgi:hypothetical protein